MDFNELKDKAASLPQKPGIYLMRDSEGRIIYVGKAKKLKNRVSQYFVNSDAHSLKTRRMVSNIYNFDVIIASSEFEALVLECAQIKRHMPKYNILLKDGKGYPYLRLDMKQQYPRLTIVNKPVDDDASYYGPFGSRGVTQNLLNTINEVMLLPSCNRSFPRDLGKGRVCLNYHMNRCAGWCQMEEPAAYYRSTMEQVKQLLQGNFKQVTDQIRHNMLEASDALNFELAAVYRNRLQAIEVLSRKQFIASANAADLDVVGYGQTSSTACFAVLHFSDGQLVDKDFEILRPDDPQTAVSSLLKQYYMSRGYAPSAILLPFDIEDSALFAQLLLQEYKKKTIFKVPQRGDNVRLVELAVQNALAEANRISDKEEKQQSVLSAIAGMLDIEKPKRIESYDISNISGTDNVAAMVVYYDGKPQKSEFKRFKIANGGFQDDYGSMRQVLHRRFSDYLQNKEGFSKKPDLLLIDGGVAHTQVAENVLNELNLNIPAFGMVKDERHRTRALVTADGREIRIDHQPAVFAFIGSIQEQTHNFAITYHKKLRSKRLQKSELDQIVGIGPKRKQLLLKRFSSISAIRSASLEELRRYLPADAAQAVFAHFHKEE